MVLSNSPNRKRFHFSREIFKKNIQPGFNLVSDFFVWFVLFVVVVFSFVVIVVFLSFC